MEVTHTPSDTDENTTKTYQVVGGLAGAYQPQFSFRVDTLENGKEALREHYQKAKEAKANPHSDVVEVRKSERIIKEVRGERQVDRVIRLVEQ
jgi:hypothetical protein